MVFQRGMSLRDFCDTTNPKGMPKLLECTKRRDGLPLHYQVSCCNSKESRGGGFSIGTYHEDSYICGRWY